MKKLDFETVKSIALGAVRMEQDGELVRFYRFTEREEKYYKEYDANFYMKSFATAGVKLSFKTDSESLGLKVVTEPGSSGKYFSVDVFVNGEMLDSLDNFGDKELVGNYVGADLPLGEFSKSFTLGKGKKSVTVYLPWSMKTAISELTLDDGASIEPVKPAKKILIYGDSITQGYDARRPSNRYAARLAEALSAEEINKAIGGEVFRTRLAECAEEAEPDYISVSYGSNDWNRKSKEHFIENCRGFYKTVSEKYPRATIFAITPIWRKDLDLERAFGSFLDLEPLIRECVKDLPNVTVISGFNFVPKDESFFADLRLHPNDEGFDHYFNNIIAQICK